MAMIFNAPFGGLLYMFEEITSVSWPLELTFRVFVATMCCALLSYFLCRLINSDINEFVIYAQKPESKDWRWPDIPIFVVMSAILGALTSLHTRAMLAMASTRQRLWASPRSCFSRRSARIAETAFYGGIISREGLIAGTRQGPPVL